MATTAELLAQLDPENYQTKQTRLDSIRDAGYESAAQYAQVAGISPSELIKQEGLSENGGKLDSFPIRGSAGTLTRGPNDTMFISNGQPMASDSFPVQELIGRSTSLDMVRKPMYDALAQDKKDQMLKTLRNYK